MHIRDAVPADLEALVGVWRRAVDATHDFLTTTAVDGFEERVRGELPRAAVRVAVGPDDGPLAEVGSVVARAVHVVVVARVAPEPGELRQADQPVRPDVLVRRRGVVERSAAGDAAWPREYLARAVRDGWSWSLVATDSTRCRSPS